MFNMSDISQNSIGSRKKQVWHKNNVVHGTEESCKQRYYWYYYYRYTKLVQSRFLCILGLQNFYSGLEHIYNESDILNLYLAFACYVGCKSFTGT